MVFCRTFVVIRYFFVIKYFFFFNNKFPDSVWDIHVFSRLKKNFVNVSPCSYHTIHIYSLFLCHWQGNHKLFLNHFSDRYIIQYSSEVKLLSRFFSFNSKLSLSSFLVLAEHEIFFVCLQIIVNNCHCKC